MRNGGDTENDGQCYRYEANAEYLSNLFAYIANAVRENHHHQDKREHTAQMTVSMIPTHKLSQPHKYGYEYNNRRQCMGDQSNQQDDNGIQYIRDQQLHSVGIDHLFGLFRYVLNHKKVCYVLCKF